MIFAVVAAPAARQSLQSDLGEDYAIETFETGEQCLERIASAPADLFLLDIDLRGMDGYELCRRIRANPATAAAPVLFISSLDDLDSRLAGYDAGGQDFLIKPFKLAKLKQKIEILRHSNTQQSLLRQQVAESETLTSLMLSNLDEYAVLIKFLRNLNSCNEASEVAAATMTMARGYHLYGAVQIRDGRSTITYGPAGNSSPLEESVINLVRNDGRIVSFKARSAFNFERITLLINDMPVNDDELTGRLRDHLAIAAECADSRLAGIRSSSSNQYTLDEITQIAGSLYELLGTLSARSSLAQQRGGEITQSLLADMTSAFAYLDLDEVQEKRLQTLIEERVKRLKDAFDLSQEIGETLEGVEGRLRKLLA